MQNSKIFLRVFCFSILKQFVFCLQVITFTPVTWFSFFTFTLIPHNWSLFLTIFSQLLLSQQFLPILSAFPFAQPLLHIFCFLPFKFQPSKFPLVTEDPNNDFWVSDPSPYPYSCPFFSPERPWYWQLCLLYPWPVWLRGKKVSPPPSILHLLLFHWCTHGHASPLAVLLYSFPNGAMKLSPWYLVFHYLLASVNDTGHLKPLSLMILCYRCGQPWSVIHYQYGTCLIYISNSNDRLILIYFSCTLLLLWLMGCTCQMDCWVKGQGRCCGLPQVTEQTWLDQLGLKPLTSASLALNQPATATSWWWPSLNVRTLAQFRR